MPFPEKIRQYWMDVAGGKCKMPVYTEEDGLKFCNQIAEQVHHIIPESWQLSHFSDPNNSVGIPLCKNHHVGEGGGLPLEVNFSMHPEMFQALLDYRDGVKDAFKQASGVHRILAEAGERFWPGDESFDLFLSQVMVNLATKFNAINEVVKPEAHAHKLAQKAKHWADGLFDE